MEELATWLLTQNALHAGRLVADGFAAEGARGYHYRLLAALAEGGPASQASLGRASGIHLSDVVAALNELAAEGYVERTPDPDDRRRNVITLTTAGRDRMAVLRTRIEAIQEEFLAPLTDPEREQLRVLLRRLLAHHGPSTTTM